VQGRDCGYGQAPFDMETATGPGRMRDIETMERVRQLANVAGMMVQETRLASGLAGAGTMGLATLL
jgi:hypothetical protein